MTNKGGELILKVCLVEGLQQAKLLTIVKEGAE